MPFFTPRIQPKFYILHTSVAFHPNIQLQLHINSHSLNIEHKLLLPTHIGIIDMSKMTRIIRDVFLFWYKTTKGFRVAQKSWKYL